MAKMPIFIKKDTTGPSLRRRVNLIGNKRVFTEWTTIRRGKKPDYMLCRCSCGVEREVNVYSLTSGKSVSCGHLRKLKKGANDEAS